MVRTNILVPLREVPDRLDTGLARNLGWSIVRPNVRFFLSLCVISCRRMLCYPFGYYRAASVVVAYRIYRVCIILLIEQMENEKRKLIRLHWMMVDDTRDVTKC